MMEVQRVYQVTRSHGRKVEEEEGGKREEKSEGSQ